MTILYWITFALWVACFIATIVLSCIPKTRFKLAYMLCVTGINILAMWLNIIDLIIRKL